MNDISRRNFYNKFENFMKNIKLKPTLEKKEKELLIKYITLALLIIKTDKIYEKTTNKSGILSIFKILGLEDDLAEKIKNLLNNGADISLLSLLTYKNISVFL